MDVRKATFHIHLCTPSIIIVFFEHIQGVDLILFSNLSLTLIRLTNESNRAMLYHFLETIAVRVEENIKERERKIERLIVMKY